MALVVSDILLVCFIFSIVNACGPVTHIEISYRALYNYYDIYGDLSYNTVLQQNQDALEAGSAFPDAFYPDQCFNGKFHDVSEDTHWTPFINASINYIQRKYPKPWDMNTQKLITFIMGVLSHQVADVSWHSLGIDQGFLQAMSRINYHGDFPTAHGDGDLGGDVLNLYQLNLNYSDVIGDWYVPVDDLLEIYREYYGTNRVTEDLVVQCSKLLYLMKVGERVAVRKYYPISASKSTYLIDELYSYFLGGIQDMAIWTQRIWKHFTFAMEHGQRSCKMDHNPLFIHCNDSAVVPARRKTSPLLKNGFYSKFKFDGATVKDVVAEKSGKGVVFKAGKELKDKIQKVTSGFDALKSKSLSQEDKKSDNHDVPKALFTIRTDYAKLGRAYAVADLNGDGNEDVVIGCPGFYSQSHQQSGIVFILFGTDQGLNTSILDIYEAANVRIPGPEDPHGAHSEFGSALAILDFDKDGKLDIAVSAPAYGSVNLTYTGKVFLFSPIDSHQYVLRGAVTCKEVYCNLGSSLAVGDMNSDKYDDLVIGSHLAPAGGEQRGTVGVVHADNKYAGKLDLTLTLTASEPKMTGSQNYSWYGQSLAVKKFDNRNETYMIVGEPTYRQCARSGCPYDPADIQAIGQAHLYHGHGKTVTPGRILMMGKQEFQMFGHSLDIGRPFGQYTDVVAISATAQDVDGHVSHVAVKIKQVGSVYLFNLTNPYQYPLTVFNGDRKFGRFGDQIKFADLNRDGFDDLIISAPLRTNDFSGELYGAQQGRVYVYMGGQDFPRGDATSKCRLLHPVEPCPGMKAARELRLEESFARFGSQLAVVRCKNKVNLLVTAEHSSKKARLGGVIGLYEF